MSNHSTSRLSWNDFSLRRGGLKGEDLARVDPFVQEALSENKRNGLRLAVRTRWIALAVIALLIPFLNPTWEALYYEAAVGVFALVGWAQLRAGQVAQSRWELFLIFVDLALLTFIMVFPNPLRGEVWPTAYQFELGEFAYFYVFLAAGTLAYSWRTIVAFGTWTTGLWLAALALVVLFGFEIPELSQNAAAAFAGYERIANTIDPNDPGTPERIQEVIVFIIVAGILAVNGHRNNKLIFRQANIARERANLARYFPPSIVDEMAGRDQPLGAIRSQNVAVMFVDIVGFTRMAEKQSPEEVVALLRQFHARLESQVFEHHGTLDKFLGDGLMATFGTPEPSPADAANALGCGRAMLADIEDWNLARKNAGAEAVKVSIGLHYGPVVLGDIGSERRLEYAVLGDAVNVASRLEALTRTLGVAMVTSDDLAFAIRRGDDADAVEVMSGLVDAGHQQLRGRDEPIKVWTC